MTPINKRPLSSLLGFSPEFAEILIARLIAELGTFQFGINDLEQFANVPVVLSMPEDQSTLTLEIGAVEDDETVAEEEEETEKETV